MEKEIKYTEDQLVESISTRDQVLAKSLEIINRSGMVNFRIDALATGLDLSPGNITYHFSRKEDISVALWEAYLQEYYNVEYHLTNLLDIKQLYLLNRINMQLNYKYRGVLIFRSADQGAMTRDRANDRCTETRHHCISDTVFGILLRKGYLIDNASLVDKVKEMHKNSHYLFMRWGINMGYHIWPTEEVESHIDHMALLCLYSMYPMLNERGKAEFMEVAKLVESGKLMDKI